MSWLHTAGTLFWSVFALTFLGVAIWGSARPERALLESTEGRWTRHVLLFAASFLVSAVLLPISPVLIAAAVSGSRIGLLNKPWLPLIVRWIVAVLILDLAKYASHRALHSVGFLWRVHRVHHSDRDFDVSTSVRSHPLEVVLSQGATLATIALIAPPIGAVLAAQLISVFESFFSHANASLPERLREGLGLIYTPDTHRIHHAVDIGMQNRNFGDIFPWWDFLFGTYHPPRSASEDRLAIGLEEFQDGISPGVMSLLKEPFTGVTKE